MTIAEGRNVDRVVYSLGHGWRIGGSAVAKLGRMWTPTDTYGQRKLLESKIQLFLTLSLAPLL